MLKIDTINANIIVENKRNGVLHVPGIHKCGVRVYNRKRVNMYGYPSVRHTMGHRWESWRENNPGMMLNLNSKTRIKIGKQIQAYFEISSDCSRRTDR